MKKLINFLSLSFVVLILFSGCQQDPTSVDTFQVTKQQSLSKLVIPFGASVDSAYFFINVSTANNEAVTLHRITADWQELNVTWNNFGGSFDPTVENSFTSSSAGWYSTDVTSLVNNWLNNTNPNYGILLKEESPDTLQNYTSREAGSSPYLIVWWTLNDTITGYDSTDAMADSYIQSNEGDTNFGSATDLITGWQDTVEYQSLVKFEIEITTQGGCTRSKGYWKTHSIYGPAPYDSTWSLLGEDSTFFLSNQTNYEVMWTPPSGGNAYYMLAHQYIAVALNILAGADPADVQEAFNDATELFEAYTPEQIGELRGNDPLRQEFISTKNALAQFNEGHIGPGNCENTGSVFPNKSK